MSGPSPYNALFEIFGNGRPTKDEDHQQKIQKSADKLNKIQYKKEHKHNYKKPLQIDNACQTQPLRDYSYNKVVEPSKRKANKKNHEKCDNFKIHCNDNARFSDNYEVYKKRTSSTFGMHLKQSHVCALYKTVSDIERIFREERNLHLHSRKCLCSSCGALGVITESMKHPVDFSDDSSETDDDDDELDDDDDDDDDDDNDDDEDDNDNDEYYNALPRYNSSKKSWKIEYKDSESIRYGFPSAEGYLRLIVELEKMIKRVKSLERLAVRYNIPVRRNKVDVAFDMQTERTNSISKSPKQYLNSTSSSEIDKKQCGLFSIPNIIKRRFSKNHCLGIKQETKNDMKNVPIKLRSKNYKHKTSDTPIQNVKKNTYIETDKKYHSNCLDEKIQNFDLALLNEDEICELMFHLKNKDLNNANRMKQRTMIPSNTAEKERSFLNQKSKIQNPKSNQTHQPNHSPFKMGTSPVGFRTTTEKTSKRSLRNDATFIRRSPNYFENNIETNRNTRNLFDEFLNINNITPAEQYNETNVQRRQNVLHRDRNVSEESNSCYNMNSGTGNIPQNDTVHKLNLEITKHEQKSEKDNMKTSKKSLLHNTSNFSKKDWMNEIINKSTGVIEEKYSQEMKISDKAIKAKIGKTVTYSKQNEYHYFKNSLMDIKSVSEAFYNPIEIGESSGVYKQMHQVEQIESSDSDLSKEYGTYNIIDNIPRTNRNISEIFLPLTKNSSQLRTLSNDNRSKHDVHDKLKSSLLNEDLIKKEFKMAEIPINNNKQFIYDSETHNHPLRSELRSQNENTTSKAPIEPVKNQHDEKVAQFISKNIFEKPPIIENTTDSMFIDMRNSYENDNAELKALQKSENKKITENENLHRKYNEETNNIQKRKFVVKANAEVQSTTFKEPIESVKKQHEEKIAKFISKHIFEKPPIIENTTDSMFTDMRNSYENDNRELKSLQKSEYKKITENENMHRKYSEETNNIQKRKFVVKANAEVQTTTFKEPIESVKKQHDEKIAKFISKHIFEKPPIIENTTDSMLIDMRNSYKNENGELKSMQKSENKNITENKNIHRKYSETTRKTQKRKFVVKANAEAQTCEVNKNTVKNKIFKRKENKETQLKGINDEREKKLSFKKDNVETKLIRKIENKNISTNEFFNKKDSENIQKNVVESKRSNEKCNEVKNSQICEVNKNLIKKIKSIKIKDNKGTQVIEINGEKENIIEEIHECPLSFIFNNYPTFNQNDNNSQVMKKSILKTYRRTINESPLKLDKKNSVVINKFKKRLNFNIVQKVSSSIVNDIFNRKSINNAALTKVFKRTNHTIKKENNRMTSSRIPIPICHQINKGIVPNITNNYKNISRIPIYLNKANNKADSENKQNLKIPQKKSDQKKKPTSKLMEKNEIGNSQDTCIYKYCVTPKSVSTKNKFRSKIPVLNKKQQNEVCKRSITSKSLGKSNLVISGKKATLYPSSIITNNDLSSTFPQHINLYSAFISIPSPSNTRKQDKIKPLPVVIDILNNYNSQIEKVDSTDETKILSLNSDILNSYDSEIDKVECKIDTDSADEAKLIPVDSDILNSYNSEIGKVDCKIDTDSTDEAKLLSVDSDILNSYKSQIERVERRKDTDSTYKAKVLSTNSDILNSYNSQIEKVERKIVTDSTDDDKNSNYPTTESKIIPNDVTEENSFYITPPYAIETYESSCTFSEDSSGAIFIYKSKCQLGTDKSIVDSEFDTRISESVYTSTSDLSPSKKNKKWKWLKTFGSKFKSILSVHTPKTSTVESFLMDGNTSCNVSNEICNEKQLKKTVNEDNIRKCCKIKWNKKPKASSLSFTLTLKKKNINSSILLN